MTRERTTDGSPTTRRRLLAATGGVLGGSGLGRGAGDDSAGDPPPPDPRAAGDPTDFLWLQRALWRDAVLRDELLAFARTHDLGVMLCKADAHGENAGEIVAEQLAAIRRRGLPAWLATGVLRRLTAREFVSDAARRRTHLRRLRDVVAAYHEAYPGGRVVLWQEAPVAGTWISGGVWNEAAVDAMQRHGPAIFEAQRRAVAAVSPSLSVGIFPHFPYVVDGRRPEVFAGLVSDLADRGASPDFAFCDFYRGYYEAGAGPSAANRAIRSLVANCRERVDGPVFYMGEPHTNNRNYTPGKQSLRLDLRASADADARGWYVRTAYHRTEQGFNPLVPNRWPRDAVPGGRRTCTYTVGRDRLQYAYAVLRASEPGFDPGARFDCWVSLSGADFFDHRLSLRSAAGEWERVGHLPGYVDGTHADGDRHVTAFRALDRERYLDADGRGTLEARIDTGDAGDARLESVHVLPFDPRAYLAEPAATAALRDRTPDRFALGSATPERPLAPGTRERVAVSVGDVHRPPVELAYPDHAEAVWRLAAAEAADLAPRAAFDLWLVAEDGSGADLLAEAAAVVDGRRRGLRAESAAAAAADGVAAFYGLERSPLLGALRDGGLEVGGPAVSAGFALPYFGSDAFVPPSRAATLVERDRGDLRVFALDAVRPGG